LMPSAGGSANGLGVPNSTLPAVGIPVTSVPNPSAPGPSGTSGSGNSSTGNATQSGQSLASRNQQSTLPIMNNPLNSNDPQDDAIPKVTEQAGKFYVQYGVFSSACRSEQVKDKLSQAGIYSVMDKLDPEGEHWIVKSKPFASRAEAIYNLQTAQRKGYESYLVNAN
jgi:cell division protein FtsN